MWRFHCTYIVIKNYCNQCSLMQPFFKCSDILFNLAVVAGSGKKVH